MKTPILLALAGFLAGCGDRVQAPSPAAAPSFTFISAQATNAWTTIETLVTCFSPRDGGTAGSERAARWILSRLTAHGVPAKLDSFEDMTPQGPHPFVNVLATIPGTGDDWILLLTHFDTMRGIGNGFQGANDSGSSTGLLLEFAAYLKTQPPQKHNVLIAFLDGEECMFGYSDRDGFHGSKHLANEMRDQKKKIKAVILLDMVGDRDLHLTIPHNGTPELRLLALKAAEAVGARNKVSLFDGVIYDDHQAFLDLGYPAVNLIDFHYGSVPGGNDYWHTPQDTFDKLSVDSLLVTGRIVMEMLNRLNR